MDLKTKLLILVDRRTSLAVFCAGLIFTLGWHVPTAVPACVDAIAIISLALGGSNAVQKAAIAFASRVQPKSETAKTTTK